MTHFHEPLTINITTSPKELRALADKMEEIAPQLTIRRTCFVHFLAHAKEYKVCLFFDQERTKGSPSFRSE